MLSDDLGDFGDMAGGNGPSESARMYLFLPACRTQSLYFSSEMGVKRITDSEFRSLE